MDIHIREIESKDYTSAAAIWRDVLGFSSVTDESVIETYEKMKGDDRYCTFVAEVNNTVVGFATTVETLAIDHPNGYMKLRLDLHQVFSGQVRTSFTSVWAIKNYRFGSARRYEKSIERYKNV